MSGGLLPSRLIGFIVNMTCQHVKTDGMRLLVVVFLHRYLPFRGHEFVDTERNRSATSYITFELMLLPTAGENTN